MSSVVSSQDSIDSTVHIKPSIKDGGSYVAQPKPAKATGKQFVSSQEADTSTDDVPLTPLCGSRREGFNWGVPFAVDSERKHSRDPMPPAPLTTRTPPPLNEIIRRMTAPRNSNTDDFICQRTDSIELDDIASQNLASSMIGDGLQRTDARRSSIATFARGMAKHVPDMRMFLQSDKASDRKGVLVRRDSQDAETILSSGKERKSSLALPSVLKSSHSSCETTLTETPIVEKPSQLSTTTPKIQPPSRGSLRDRRKVKLDLSLPSEMPDIPIRSRPPAIALSSITPSRPRSPKTPWIRNEPPSWDLRKLPRSAPIMEEGYMQQGIMGPSHAGSIGLMPDSDAIISSHSPRFERSSPEMRDRRYISRPTHHRSRSGRGGTSDSLPARSLDANLPPLDEQALQAQQVRTAQELQQLSQTTHPSRQRRWWWKSSSDEGLQTPEPSNRRFSLNLFKRPARCCTPSSSDPKTPNPASACSWRSRQVATMQPPFASLTQMNAPPTFVPPGLHRVPTPPLFDANGEVKGKLADFFFDVHGTSGLRKKTSGTRGLWDSDALLMSVFTDLTSSDSEDEEGPEGPMAPPMPLEADSAAALTPTGAVLGPMLGRDKWYGVETGTGSPDEQALTYLALQDEEAQRKFEWLVPEHLPSSPLCPLHPIYRGPCKGVCYWHGPRVSVASRRSIQSQGKGRVSREVGKSWDVRETGEAGQPVRRGKRGWVVGEFDPPSAKEESVRRKRLASFE